MPASLRTRLQRLRLQKAKQQVPASVPVEVLAERAESRQAARRRDEAQRDLPGRLVTTGRGTFQLIESRYELDFRHGPLALAALLGRDSATAARLARDEALAQTDLRSLAFLDTETTGLAGGAGTLAFLVGVGVFEDGAFLLRQYFLREPGEEEAMLTALLADLAPRAGWVTFNGRSFDLPLLETRLTLNRLRGALGRRPHLDLLMPARRLYRGRLESCSLGHLEQHIFHIIREQDDVPGALIPQLYLDYLRSGDAREMHRVIYHNAVDVLSMVTLASHLLEVFATPVRKPTIQGPKSQVKPGSNDTQLETADLGPIDFLRLAKLHADNGRYAEAEAAFTQALAGPLSLDDRQEALRRWARLLRHLDRRAEAAPLWEQLASFTVDDPEPFLELAKFYEWHAPDFTRAQQWAERAHKVVSAWPRGWQRSAALAPIQTRLARLKRKIKSTK